MSRKPNVEVFVPMPIIKFGDGKLRLCCLECAAGAVEALSKKTWQQQRDFVTKIRAVLRHRQAHSVRGMRYDRLELSAGSPQRW